MKNILIGNGFPTSLIRRQVTITPYCIFVLRDQLKDAEIYSFWGHRNTLHAVNSILGVNLTPTEERPSIDLNDKNYPCFQGVEFHDCWIISPNYKENYRPQIGEETPAEQIKSWQVLKIQWS